MTTVKTIHDKVNVKNATKIIKLKPEQQKEENNMSEDYLNEGMDTETFYNNIMEQMKTIIKDQERNLISKEYKMRVIEKAIEIKSNEMKREIEKRNNEVNSVRMELEIMKQEVDYHRDRESNKSIGRDEARKTVKELYDIQTKRREIHITEAQLDDEAREYLKRYE
jgi:hypothetical protein